jgi:hypothetical protein
LNEVPALSFLICKWPIENGICFVDTKFKDNERWKEAPG